MGRRETDGKKEILEIPANPMLKDLRKRKQKLRVEAYCRVSTEQEEQQNSFEVQVDYYTEKITHHDGWQLAGIFADEGISEVRSNKRKQFKEMIDLCRGKIKKNNGELPQYYIQNNHPAIISREVFHQVQEEISRRNSKKPATQKKTKTNRGRFTSKYPLSERMVCGNCGCYYRRITWNIHGRRQVVWRCINRVEFGKRYCNDSPSIPEESLQQAILEAVRSLIRGHQEEMVDNLRHILENLQEGAEEAAPIVIENRLKELEQEFDRLLLMAGTENEIIDRRLEKINNEMMKLKQLKKRTERNEKKNMVSESKYRKVMEFISAEDLELTEYSDALVYRIIERVTVLSKEEIQNRFIGGYEITQKIQ